VQELPKPKEDKHDDKMNKEIGWFLTKFWLWIGIIFTAPFVLYYTQFQPFEYLYSIGSGLVILHLILNYIYISRRYK